MAPVRAVEIAPTHGSEVHFDLSGPFRQNLGGRSYAAHLLESRTSFSHVAMPFAKIDLAPVVTHFVLYINSRFSYEGYSVKDVHADNAKVNLTSDVDDFCRQLGVTTEKSPPHAPPSN